MGGWADRAEQGYDMTLTDSHFPNSKLHDHDTSIPFHISQGNTTIDQKTVALMKPTSNTPTIQNLTLFLILLMLTQTANSLRVAVLGSGISGATAARSLADRGVQVTVFEAGFGIGGRTSTRITRDEHHYQFDHGAQYIGRPKTSEFEDTLRSWRDQGWVKEWVGSFASVDGADCTMESKERWVGYPGMHSICRNLLHHKNIRVQTSTQAHASQSDDQNTEWELVHGKTKEHLGTFDWLVASDRNSAAHYRKDLSSVNLEEFTSGVKQIKSVKSLTAMVVFESPINLKMDGIQFTGNDPQYGSLGWAARDSSKPGRERNDGQECWVLQSHPDAAKELLKGKRNLSQIREIAKEALVRDFIASIPHLAEDVSIQIPSVTTSIGHRWGAAFPIPSKDFSEMESQVITNNNFVACGDYFGALSGRIEGAFLSGRSAAGEILDCNKV
jgi:predicted NAD/FAD-dependent oxidoreductase